MDCVMKGRRRRKRRGDLIFPKFLAWFLLFTKRITAASVSPSDKSFVLMASMAPDSVSMADVRSSPMISYDSPISQKMRSATPFILLLSSFLTLLLANPSPSPFSTSFVFAIYPQYNDISSHGSTFGITPSTNLTVVLPSQHLGLFNLTNNGDLNNHIVAVKLDTIQNKEFDDINDNHVGIDVDGLISISSAPASFFLDSSGLQYKNLSLISGEQMRVWAEYDGESMLFDVTFALLSDPKPVCPLLSLKLNLSSYVLDDMHDGFAASTGAAAGSHYFHERKSKRTRPLSASIASTKRDR